MELEPTIVFLVSVAAVALSLVAIGLGIAALVGQRRTKRAYQAFALGSDDDVLTLLQRHLDEVARLRDDVAAGQARTAELRERIKGSVSQVATVRYDAFEDMGGRLSFSTALLDEHGDGVVITAINGRVETRTYAKPVRAAGSRIHRSQEEVAAVEQARSAKRRRRDAVPADADADLGDEAGERFDVDVLPAEMTASVRRLDADEPRGAHVSRAAEAS